MITKQDKKMIVDIIKPISAVRNDSNEYLIKYLSRYVCAYFSSSKRKAIYEFVREYVKENNE